MANNSFSKARAVVEIILLIVAFVAGVVVAICVGVTMDKFKGSCPLYAYAEYDTPIYFTVHFSSQLNCKYIIAVESITGIIAVGAAIYRAVFLWRSKTYSRGFGPLLFTAIFALCWTLHFVAACIVTVGFKQFCHSLIEGANGGMSWPETCAGYQKGVDWQDGLDGSTFYTMLNVASITSWIGFVVWLCLPLIAWLGMRFVTNRPYNSSPINKPSDVST